MTNTYATRSTLETAEGTTYSYHSIPKLSERFPEVASLPWSLKVLLENLLRHEDGIGVTEKDIEALAKWNANDEPQTEISFTPSRVLLQDFTGVPAVVDLASMRDAMKRLGGDPSKINPLQPVDLVIDHSVQVDEFRGRLALEKNIDLEYERNTERYAFLRWGQGAFSNFTAVPPGAGIVHQINLEYLARVAFVNNESPRWVYPDSLVGTDSHTTMVNGLGVLGWGVGGIEAEAAMLGQPISMLIPQVVGFELTGELPEGTTATDLVLTVTKMCRDFGVVGKFVEFYGEGVSELSLADRATLGNMSPEFGSTCAIFPVDAETVSYLKMTGRSDDAVALVEQYFKAQGMFHEKNSDWQTRYSYKLSLDLGAVEPCISGPRRPQDRIALKSAQKTFRDELAAMGGGSSFGRTTDSGEGAGGTQSATVVRPTQIASVDQITDGSVVIAAITSCTNTSNPSVMIGAGLVAKKAAERGLSAKPWIKTSLAPGSKVVTRYLAASGLDQELEKVGFFTVGYGCTTCIGNSGPLPGDVLEQVEDRNLIVASVLSGNRNFEGRISGDVRMNFLASPPLVVAYSIAGHMDWDPLTEPLGSDTEGNDVFLSDIWPSNQEVREAVSAAVRDDMFTRTYDEVYKGDEHWRSLPTPGGDLYTWNSDSTYIRRAPYFDDMPATAPGVSDITGARCLVKVADSVTTDHISPAGSFKEETPAGRYLTSRGVERRAFNSYGSRRGNHEVMVRGTFANVRLRNEIAPGTEGGFSRILPSGEQTTIFEASEHYIEKGIPTIVLAGREYGSGSSRDWAAKGPALLGIKAVLAESYERIHRSNLIGMGIVPLQYQDGENAEYLGLNGLESFDIQGLSDLFDQQSETSGLAGDRKVLVTATAYDGGVTSFKALVRVDTPKEAAYLRHGGILQYVLRDLLD